MKNGIEIVFDRKARLSILAEVARKPGVETGGVLLGYRQGDVYLVVEATDCGPNAECKENSVVFDEKYLNHMVMVLSGLYESPLEVLGVWHKHPYSFDEFSNDDINVSNDLVKRIRKGTISVLVNTAPTFRFTGEYIDTDLNWISCPVKIATDDSCIIRNVEALEEYINQVGQLEEEGKRLTLGGAQLLDDGLSLAEGLTLKAPIQLPKLGLNEIEDILTGLKEDFDFFRNSSILCDMQLEGRLVAISFEKKMTLYFTILNEKIYFKHNSFEYEYIPSLFKALILGLSKAKQEKRKIDKCLVEEIIEDLKNV